MQQENFIEKISSGFSQSAALKNVFGEPITAGDKTIIPVARIAYGFGGGFGEGHQKEDGQKPGSEGAGGGAGGGMHASAKGVYEITPTSTRFIPASPYKHILAGVVIGLVVKSLFVGRKR
jgi:uncharacterized spore protein YtfJ